MTRVGLERSRLTCLIALGILLMGVISYIQIPKREDPAVTIRIAQIEASFPGMDTQRVEDLIAKPLERVAREVGEIEDIETWVTDGKAELSVTIYAAVPTSELDRVFQDIRNKMLDAKGQLPEGTVGPMVNTDFGDVGVATIAVTGEGFDYAELWDAADGLREDLYTLNGIKKVTVFGRQEERIWLDLDSRKLASIGKNVNQVLDDLKAQNIIASAGTLTAGGQRISLEVNGDFKSVDAIGDLLTKLPEQSGFTRLKDFVSVRRGYADPPTAPIYYNEKPALILSVEMAEDRDVQKIGNMLKEAVPRFEQKHPTGIQFEFSTFQEQVVTQTINGALKNVGQTFAVVFLAVLLFLGIRPALVIASIVPFAAMFSLIVMVRWGVALEQISIAAVIISLGLLVDNGLVVVEEVQKKLDLGVPPKEAACQAGGQFLIPLAMASITTISAFIPMFILDGAEGEMAFSLGAVVAFMLTGSWLSAHYLLPLFAVHILKPSKKKERESLLVKLYGKLCRSTIRHGLFVLIVSLGAVAASISLFGVLKAELFPPSERNEYLVYLDMPRGATVEATIEEARAVDTWLNDKEINPEIENTTVYVASGGPRFYIGLDPAEGDPANAFIVVNASDSTVVAEAADRAWAYLTDHRPAARYRVTRLSMGEGEPGIVEYKLRGPDGDVLLAKAKEIEAGLALAPGITTNENDWGNKRVKLTMDVSQDKARVHGLSSAQIAEMMDTFFSGKEQSIYREGSESIPIVLRAESDFRTNIGDLQNLAVVTPNGMITLDQIADIEPHFEYAQIRRENQVRQITVFGKSATLTAPELQAFMEPHLQKLELPEGYSLGVGGESETSEEVNELLMNGMPPALLLILTALMLQFNSVRRVSLTFMTIPLVVIGAPLALYVTGRPLSFFAILGLISLAGIIINNAIVLIDQIDIERRSLPLDEAIVAAAKKRVTPILLTSLTTVLGLVPMALTGGVLFQPMATLMIGGLLLASPITLVFVPSLYRTLFAFGKFKAQPE
ncbi:acriflavin resistance protein [Pseudovibrio sp. JE062]|nr:acriflavin resistance protein [Pseudovibrio sp. JE062]